MNSPARGTQANREVSTLYRRVATLEAEVTKAARAVTAAEAAKAAAVAEAAAARVSKRCVSTPESGCLARCEHRKSLAPDRP